jgi:hypothetical protein
LFARREANPISTEWRWLKGMDVSQAKFLFHPNLNSSSISMSAS